MLWDMLHSSDKHWVRVLEDKYHNGKFILSITLKPGSSYIWRSLLEARDSRLKGFKPRLREPQSSFWYSNWKGKGQLCNQVPYVHISDTNFTVANFCENNGWRGAHLHRLLPREWVQHILSIPVPQNPTRKDTICWVGIHSRVSSSLSAYGWLKTFEPGKANSLWWRI